MCVRWAALTGYREVVERVGQVRVLGLVLVADEGAVCLQQEVARPPVFDVLACRRRRCIDTNRLHQLDHRKLIIRLISTAQTSQTFCFNSAEFQTGNPVETESLDHRQPVSLSEFLFHGQRIKQAEE